MTKFWSLSTFLILIRAIELLAKYAEELDPLTINNNLWIWHSLQAVPSLSKKSAPRQTFLHLRGIMKQGEKNDGKGKNGAGRGGTGGYREPGAARTPAAKGGQRSPSHLLRPWSLFLTFTLCSNAFEYRF